MVLEASNAVYKNALNIFTDASVINRSISLPAFIMLDGKENKEVNNYGMALANSTNNEGEVYAIKLAIQSCLNPFILNMMDIYYGGRYINIFSDSKITVLGLREWYASWIKNKRNGILVSSSGTPVANQEIFIYIMKMIHDYDLKVNFYHVSGHVNVYNSKQLFTMIQDFRKFNYDIRISYEFAAFISDMNNKIDNFTRSIYLGNPIDIKTNEIFKASIEENFDVNKYNSLIQRRI